MDTEITVHLDEQTLKTAVKLAAYKGLSLDQLIKRLIQEAAEKEEKFLQQFPVADWVLQLGEQTNEHTVKNYMETEILMKLDENLVHAVVDFANRNNLGFQELVRLMLEKVVGSNYQKFADMPIADWVRELNTDPIDFTTENKPWKERKKEYYESKL